MKLIGSLLVASAYAGIWAGKRSGSPVTSGSPYSSMGSVVDDIMDGYHPESGERSGRPMSG